MIGEILLKHPDADVLVKITKLELVDNKIVVEYYTDIPDVDSDWLHNSVIEAIQSVIPDNPVEKENIFKRFFKKIWKFLKKLQFVQFYQ